MRTYVIAYLATALVFFGLDFIWLSRVAVNFYRTEIGGILADRPNMLAAGLFYLIYIAGIVYFAVHLALERQSLPVALINGALLGLIAYGTYDMTNLATLKNWPVNLTIVDMTWGTVLTAVAAGAGYWAVSFMRI